MQTVTLCRSGLSLSCLWRSWCMLIVIELMFHVPWFVSCLRDIGYRTMILLSLSGWKTSIALMLRLHDTVFPITSRLDLVMAFVRVPFLNIRYVSSKNRREFIRICRASGSTSYSITESTEIARKLDGLPEDAPALSRNLLNSIPSTLERIMEEDGRSIDSLNEYTKVQGCALCIWYCICREAGKFSFPPPLLMSPARILVLAFRKDSRLRWESNST